MPMGSPITSKSTLKTMKNIPILHHSVAGSGPTVVLLHGYLASSAYWQTIADELSRTHRVIAIDLLGFGRSPKPACSRYDYDAQLTSINHTLEKLNVTEPFTLIGHSMGSLISLRYARTFPQRVKKLLLANMPVFASGQQAKQEILSTNFVYRIGLRPGFHWMVWPLFRLALSMQLIPEKVSENAAARRAYIFQNTAVSRLRSMRNIIYAAKIQADLQTLEMTTLLLSGLNDRARYLQNIADLKFGSNVSLANIAGGHHLPLTHPQLVSEYVRS